MSATHFDDKRNMLDAKITSYIYVMHNSIKYSVIRCNSM